ncbi:hypothetical protein LINGRAHAP2_LOCUS5703 [Linum grandiflorum]
MATENCISDCDVPLSQLRRCSGKRQRIISQGNLDPISKLGSELLAEILIRLPSPTSACRCRLVCKRWDSLISSPRFNHRFDSHHQTMSHPPMPLDPRELKSIILSFLPPMPCTVRDALKVLDCNRDLVLCGFWDIGCQDREYTTSYLVCNPFTKQWIALPLAPRKHAPYMLPAARLVCEPRNFSKLDLGDDQSFVHSEYRFRVVCIYQVLEPEAAIKLNVFCSESGEWTKEALVCQDHVRTGSKSVVSCNGELFWKYVERHDPSKVLLAAFNPFRLDIPPTSIDVSVFLACPHWFISASQGELHVIVMENETVPVRSSTRRLEQGYKLSIRRLEQDRKSWRIQCQGLVPKTSECCNYEVEGCYQPFLHPHKPGIVFFNPVPYKDKNAILCCDLARGELEFFAKLEGPHDVFYLQVFQPSVSCWATPIPRYEELRGMYDGSYSFWVQSSSEAKTHSLPSHYICMDDVMKSRFYNDYIELVTEEETLKMVADIIQQRIEKIREIILRERQQHPFRFDKALDVLEADLKDVEAEMATISKRKEELKQRLVCETSAEL